MADGVSPVGHLLSSGNVQLQESSIYASIFCSDHIETARVACSITRAGVCVKGKVYRSYHIVGVAHLNEKSGYWLPRARVLWTDAGREQKFELDGPPNRFRTKDEAEDYAVAMGENWIDKKNPIP